MKKRKRIKIKPLIGMMAFITCLIVTICFLSNKRFIVKTDSYLINLGDNFNHDFVALYKGKDVSDEVEVDLRDLDVNKTGKYEIVFKYKNNKKKLVMEVKDTIVPVINLFNGSKINIPLNDGYADPGYQAIDNVDGDITSNALVEGKVETNKEGQYKIKYKVIDKAGNTATAERLVIVGGKSPLLLDVANFTLNGYYQNALLKENKGANNYLDDFIFAGDSMALYYVINKIIPGKRLWHQIGINPETALTTPIFINHNESGLTFVEAFAKYKPNKVILTIGTNSGYMEIDYFVLCYKKLVQELKKASPETLLIVQSIPPIPFVWKSNLTNDKINKMNYYLLKMCSELNIYFLNSAEVLKDDSGQIKYEYYRKDDVPHPSVAGGRAMYDYALNHAVND